MPARLRTCAAQSPSGILQEWAAGTIDAAFVWGSTYRSLLASGGSVLISSGAIARWDRAIYQALVVRREFLAAFPEIVQQFVHVLSLLDASLDSAYSQHLWTPEPVDGYIASVADALYLNGSSLADRLMLGGWMQHPPAAAEQLLCSVVASCPATSTPNMLTMMHTATFLRDQKTLFGLQPTGRFFSPLPIASLIDIAERNKDSVNFDASILQAVLPTLTPVALQSLLTKASAASATPATGRHSTSSELGADSTCLSVPVFLGAGNGMAPTGFISDGAAAAPGLSYSDGLNCTWVLMAASETGLVELANLTVRVWSHDRLLVYAGSSTSGDLLAQLGGHDSQWPRLRALGAMTVMFLSDMNRSQPSPQ